jgi:hypothetical protein
MFIFCFLLNFKFLLAASLKKLKFTRKITNSSKNGKIKGQITMEAISNGQTINYYAITQQQSCLFHISMCV